MPLHILLLLVVGGIAGIAVLSHFLGLSSALTFPTKDAARDAWLRNRPEDQVLSVRLSDDHKAALIETELGIGLVWSVGADSTARLVHDLKIEETPDGLRLVLGEYTAPSLTLCLKAEERAIWLQKLKDAA